MSSQDRRRIETQESWPVTELPLSEIAPGELIRASGIDAEHVRILSETDEDLPPILVQKSSMRVIDGMHRLRAAQLLGRTGIRAQLLDVTDADAFLRSVAANVVHGLPLTLADRKSAALRVIALHPGWSDRAVGSAAGVSPKTVQSLRRLHGAELPQPARRVGIDGRVRPVDATAGRRVVTELLTANPQMAVRQVAKRAGVAPGTVRKVRDGLARGRDVEAGAGRAASLRPDRTVRAAHPESAPASAAASAPAASPAGQPQEDAETILHELRQDPTLKYRAGGRDLLRMLGVRPALLLRRKVVDVIPAHRVPAVATLFRLYAQEWLDLAGVLERSRSSERVGAVGEGAQDISA